MQFSDPVHPCTIGLAAGSEVLLDAYRDQWLQLGREVAGTQRSPGSILSVAGPGVLRLASPKGSGGIELSARTLRLRRLGHQPREEAAWS